VVCENDRSQIGSLNFSWSEVRDRVEGQLPIFEEVVDQDAHHKLQWKTKTQDYAQFCDLHLPARRSILRLSDSSYQFPKGIPFNSQQSNQPTNRTNWNNLLTFLNQQLQQTPVWSDFNLFAQSALDYAEMLKTPQVPHSLVSPRRNPLGPCVFQLYSGLVFLRSAK
jgi:hypothetical protein